jgi:hypothetical protein
LGDTHYDAENVREKKCERTQRFLVTSKRGAYPHTDDGVEVRRIFHKLRSLANENFNENFNEHFKSIFEVHESRFPPRTGSTPPASLLGQYWFTSWLYSTVMSEMRRSIVDSNHSSELLDEL